MISLADIHLTLTNRGVSRPALSLFGCYTCTGLRLLAIQISIGVDSSIPPDNEFDTGLLETVNCVNLNGKYQAALNLLCGDFFNVRIWAAVMFDLVCQIS